MNINMSDFFKNNISSGSHTTDVNVSENVSHEPSGNNNSLQAGIKILNSLMSGDTFTGYVSQLNGNNASTNFVLETEELLDFVYQHIDRLNARLEKLGYNTHFEMKVAADSSDRLDFVKDFIEAEARPAAGGQYIFDAKA